MSRMELNVHVRDIENLRVLATGKNLKTIQPRLALGEIGNKVQLKKDKDSCKTKVLTSAALCNISVSKLTNPKSGKIDIPPMKVHGSVNSKQREKGITTCLRDQSKENASDNASSKQLQQEVRKIDQQDQKDIFLLGRYVVDIYKYLLELELKLPIKSDFLIGTSITPKMRATIIDWLLEVQTYCSFLLETFHLSVAIIDRFLQESGLVERKNFQLVGITSMFIACKFEESYYPEINDFIYMTDNAYSKQQVLDLEKEIVKKLDFRLGRPISLTFLRRYSKIVQADQFLHTLGKYFIELALLEFSLAYVRPSMVAAAAIYIALCITDNDVRSDLWTPTLKHYSTYELEDFQSTTKKLATSIKEAANSKYKGIRLKYSRSEFLCVSYSPGVQPDSPVLKKLSLMNAN